jgi:DNA-binding IclR family transcriptional regulator
VMAAFRDDAELEQKLAGPLPRLTGRTLVDRRELERALERIRRDGVAIEDQEAIIGEAEIAAAVVDHAGHAVGAVGVVGPVERLLVDGFARPDLAGAVKQVARGLSRDMAGARVYERGR